MIKKIVELKNQVEASLLHSLMEENDIPHNIKTYRDPAYDGIWQVQYGWGFVEAPLEYKAKILELYEGIKNESES